MISSRSDSATFDPLGFDNEPKIKKSLATRSLVKNVAINTEKHRYKVTYGVQYSSQDEPNCKGDILASKIQTSDISIINSTRKKKRSVFAEAFKKNFYSHEQCENPKEINAYFNMQGECQQRYQHRQEKKKNTVSEQH